jgi:hypothetical protein
MARRDDREYQALISHRTVTEEEGIVKTRDIRRCDGPAIV